LTLHDVRDAFLSVIDDVYHFKAPGKISSHYVVWGETGQSAAVSADDNPDTITVRGLMYYYTTDEYDGIFDDLCNALAEIGAAWAIQNIGYDDNTRQIIYEVAWEVPCGAGAIYK
jgi:hypothetical protein